MMRQRLSSSTLHPTPLDISGNRGSLSSASISFRYFFAVCRYAFVPYLHVLEEGAQRVARAHEVVHRRLWTGGPVEDEKGG